MKPRRIAALATAASALGFAVPPPRLRPHAAGEATHVVPLPDDLPELLRRHLDLDGDGLVPRINTLELVARAQLRLGPLPWQWARVRTVHDIGRDFVSDIALTWYGLPVFRVIDAYVGGHGMTRLGARATVGAEIDQGAGLFLWAESALIGSAYVDGRLKAVEDAPGVVRLTVPLGDGTEEALLHFDGPVPVRFSALRYKAVGGDKVRWDVEMGHWEEYGGVLLPQAIDVTWADEGRPWFRWRLDDVAVNVPVRGRLDEVAGIIAGARSASV